MNTIPTRSRAIFRTALALLACCAFTFSAFAQTAADTQIQNQASATYTDGNGNPFSTVSNTVTVTVAKVAGLVITPDGQNNSSVVPGQSNVNFTFRVTNVGNFTDQVRFLAGGQSLRVVGPGTIASAVISGPGTDIKNNAADVLQSLAQNGFVDVVVAVNISAAATPSSTVQVILGDAASGTNFDNIASNNSANEVRTVSTGAVNGSREARGDISVTVDSDAMLRVEMTAPAGPVALGSNIALGVQACNDGQRTANPLSGGSTIFVVTPIPVGTELTTGQSFPAGTEFSTDALTTLPNAATWTPTAPGSLSSVKRIRIPVAPSLASTVCSATFSFQVTITTNNANTPIYSISEAFANNSIAAVITDQSGDTFANRGDGNADNDEPIVGETPNPGQGLRLQTLLLQVGGVLLGPLGNPGATGPTDNNDDYTNRSVTSGIAGVAPGGVTTQGNAVVFQNTVQNTGNANDTMTFTAPSVPAGFTVEYSPDNATWTTISGGGSATLAVNFGASSTVYIRVTAPAGQTVLTGFDAVVRATSGITPANRNDTIDRLYTGFVRMIKTFTINNATGVGGATDAVPGAEITYTITYTNVSTSGGSGNSTLTATGLVITEDGSAAPNNWATFTDHVVGATDTLSGVIAGDAANSTSLTDTVPTVAPGQSGVFTFKRVIK